MVVDVSDVKSKYDNAIEFVNRLRRITEKKDITWYNPLTMYSVRDHDIYTAILPKAMLNDEVFDSVFSNELKRPVFNSLSYVQVSVTVYNQYNKELETDDTPSKVVLVCFDGDYKGSLSITDSWFEPYFETSELYDTFDKLLDTIEEME